MRNDQNRDTPRVLLQLGIGAAIAVCVITAAMLLLLMVQTTFMIVTEAVLVLTGIVLFVCLIAMRRRVLRPLDRLKQAVDRWDGASVETLERSVAEIPGAAGAAGTGFVRWMGHMERETVRQRERADGAWQQAQTEAEQRVIGRFRDRTLPWELVDYPSRGNFSVDGRIEDVLRPVCVFYDYFFADPGLLCVAIGQVPRDGIDETARMALAQTIIRGRILLGQSLAETMEEVNRSLFDSGGEHPPMGLLLGTLNTSNGQFRYVNAGMENPLLLRPGNHYEWQEGATVVPVGGTEHVDYRVSEVRLSPGDSLLFFTEGFGRAENAEGRRFREEGLRLSLNRIFAQEDGGAERLRRLTEDAAAYCGQDGQCRGYALLLLEYRKEAADARVANIPAVTENAEKAVEFLKKRLDENGQRPKNYARLAVLTEELFVLCCHHAEAGSSIRMNCSVAPDAQSATLTLTGAFQGNDPLKAERDTPDGQSADYILHQSDYTDFRSVDGEDTVKVVWFVAK